MCNKLTSIGADGLHYLNFFKILEVGFWLLLRLGFGKNQTWTDLGDETLTFPKNLNFYPNMENFRIIFDAQLFFRIVRDDLAGKHIVIFSLALMEPKSNYSVEDQILKFGLLRSNLIPAPRNMKDHVNDHKSFTFEN
jgi:hypothetical protein